ncbi:MAG: ATP-binding protein [Kiritimatiellae bacterium]|nr:ATP-binding protein [Kiritimatiellia bacterium]
MKNKFAYCERIADKMLLRRLSGVGAVLVEGPKWCGKTTTCEQVAKSALYMADPDQLERNLAQAATNIRELLKGATPRLIDEWQIAPKFWDAVRSHVDHAEGFGHFILTGSAVPPEDKRRKDGRREMLHTGTGRISRLRMRPMSLWESGESTGSVSLAALFAGDFPSGQGMHSSLQEIAWLACRGGWPQSIRQKGDVALDRATDYFEAIVNSDISRVDDTERNPTRARHLMRALARFQGTPALLPTIRRDMLDHEAQTMDDETIRSYMNALAKIFVTEDMPAWSPCLRSKAAIRKSDTRYFSDPSIATAALGLGPGDLMNDIRSFGYFFETLAVRDLRAYAEPIGGTVSHFLDRNGLECDAVVHLRNGTCGLVEIKLGGEALVEQGAKTLNALSALLDTSRMKAASFKMVLTAVGDYAYRRPEDGVFVCPIGCLKP